MGGDGSLLLLSKRANSALRASSRFLSGIGVLTGILPGTYIEYLDNKWPCTFRNNFLNGVDFKGRLHSNSTVSNWGTVYFFVQCSAINQLINS